jgi:predicted  nucleic acid-binding Zn-ribbon protein
MAESELSKFKLEALQRLTRIETKIERMEAYDDELHDDILALRGFVLDAEKAIESDLKSIRDEMPNANTYKLIVGIFSACLAAIFGMLMLFLR